MMCQKEFHKYFSFCVARGIRIFPKPLTANGSILKIVTENHGVETISDEKYTPENIYDKINEIYKSLYNKLNKQSNEILIPNK